MTPAWSLIAAAGIAIAPVHAQVVPTVFEAGHFFVTPETASGERLKLLVDTGGGGVDGMYLLNTQAASRLKLAAGHCTLQGKDITTAPAPVYKPGLGIPAPTNATCTGVMTYEDKHPISAMDGMLGSNYLNGRIWTFDYPAKQLILQGKHWTPVVDDHAYTLGFQKDAEGKRARAFPRVVIRVDGQPLDMLLDTGATAFPSESGKQATGTPTVNGFGVTSYITHSQLERWHAAHPGWRAVENGDELFAGQPTRMIEVPSLDIAGWSVGPVWFTERNDDDFHNLMDPLMDKPPEGAVGGNVLGRFRLTIDYPQGVAYFGCTQGCQTAIPSSRH
ncbi:hypothetical protein [Dyella japonica]|uniref:Aspartyl protease n=1 Tax=Dyella japonica A8 TaxID=1217721 RepID=A0A075K2R3_9GAMM|nr:hypothetical protein [Dyella japonica]AIF48504.1 hypothetical protein HY57_15315 [Dyella japonica A8]